MPKQQPVRVVEKKSGDGWATALGVMLLIGLAIEYWYICLGILGLVLVLAAVGQANEKKHGKLAQEQARHRPGPRDPWLNEVAVALADLELTETARNTGSQLGGAPLEGDICLEADRFTVWVNLFATDEVARQADVGLRANPKVRSAIREGYTSIKTTNEVVYVANGRGQVVDELRLDEVIQVVRRIAALPARSPIAMGLLDVRRNGPALPVGPSQSGAQSHDALAQLRKLGDLRAAGVLTDTEFGAKKAELLRRV
jgi:hypothetical protein